jgi:hypothetical protein
LGIWWIIGTLVDVGELGIFWGIGELLGNWGIFGFY